MRHSSGLLSVCVVMVIAAGALTTARLIAAPASTTTTVLKGHVRDPVDDAPIVGASVRVGRATVETGPDGRFSAIVRGPAAGYLKTVVSHARYGRYTTWTAVGETTRREIYLFPAYPFTLPDVDRVFTPAELREHFDSVYRSPDWDPRRERSLLWRWKEAPQVVIYSRRLAGFTDETGRSFGVAKELVPDRAILIVREVVSNSLRALTAGRLKAAGITVRTPQAGEIVTRNHEGIYVPGEIRVFFHDEGFYKSGGIMFAKATRMIENRFGQLQYSTDLDGCLERAPVSECLTAWAGSIRIDIGSVIRGEIFGDAYLVAHEFGHALGMLT